LHFRSAEKRSKLPEPAFGLSRFALDNLLLRNAIAAGAQFASEVGIPGSGPVILAHGRKEASVRGGRLFGFKAHFQGPQDDAIELFFFGRGYVGVISIEGGLTNICGIAPEDTLRTLDFDIDTLLSSFDSLRARVAPLRRSWKWLTVGPLKFQHRFRAQAAALYYPAGDALSFVDPFTGSGLLSAITTGRLAGLSAARGASVGDYLGQCRAKLEQPFRMSALFRYALAHGWECLAGLVPSQLLVRLTRPDRAV
jgi:hypothetical protein